LVRRFCIRPQRYFMEKSDLTLQLSTTDWLAIERTRLANERTFLAYFRTSLTLLAGGITITRLDILQEILALGYTFLCMAPIVFIIGVWRLISVKRRIGGYYQPKK